MRLSTLFLGASTVLLAVAPGFGKAIDNGLSKRQSYTNERMTYYEVGGYVTINANISMSS